MTGTCRYCECTAQAACEGGCSWADTTQEICSQCAIALDLGVAVISIFRLTKPADAMQLKALVLAMREAGHAWVRLLTAGDAHVLDQVNELVVALQQRDAAIVEASIEGEESLLRLVDRFINRQDKRIVLATS